MLVEGGARLAGSLLNEGLVDRLVIFQAPIVLGSGAVKAFGHVDETQTSNFSQLRLVAHRTVGDDLMTTYAFGAD
jgi:diaminohydroxyphosphoribosylaminopyrimidine deaminase / 5-amino-6-(5-phosphoribosylamino)uracil reductase